MDMEKLKKLGKHILIVFVGGVILTVLVFLLLAVNSHFSDVPNYFNSQSFENTFYFVLTIFLILMAIDVVFILIEPFGADSLIDFIMGHIPR